MSVEHAEEAGSLRLSAEKYVSEYSDLTFHNASQYFFTGGPFATQQISILVKTPITEIASHASEPA